MATLPTEKDSYRKIFECLNGFIKAKIMMAGLELGLFDHLNSPASADELAERLNCHPVNTARFLDALATIELIDKNEGRYRNRPLAQKFLVKDSPTYVGDLMQLHHHMSSDGIERLPDLVRQGPAAAGASGDFGSPDLWARVTRASAQWVFGEMGQTMAGIVAALPGFSDFGKMLDLGGGHGIFALYIVDAHPTMQGVVFDRPAVLETAASFCRKFGLADRVQTMPGDYLEDDIGQGYDLVFASSTLNFAKHRIDELMAKVHGALNPGGYFIAFQDGMTHERTRPDIMLGHLADSLQSEQDYVFDQGFLAEAMLRAGFRQVRSRTLDAPMGPMDLDVARK